MYDLVAIEIYQQARALLDTYMSATTGDECRQIAAKARAFAEERPVRASNILFTLADDAMYSAAIFDREKC